MQNHVFKDLESFGLKPSDWSREEIAAYMHSAVVRLAPEDAKRLDDIKKSLDAIADLLSRMGSQGVAV